ncbi:hypothetical protein L3X38_022972 [Prunus dulcis]|uniref:FBD domain-containing protein n=1 Tax=Prunus dulcis TaxID=3755 RepID=A0AAD4Z5Q1_PRUDU|nr:hypothetical protein L3X38_022972 [Prunus dulcis]
MGDKDWISELPDALLCRILSFLPTTIWAVRTSILSKRWNNVWTCVPNLDLDCGGNFGYHHCDHDRFAMFVDRVLCSRDSSDIKKFRLRTCVTDLARVEGWICTAVRRNVVELELELDAGEKYTFVLPRSVFSCKTLKVLKLHGSLCIPYAPPASRCFPSLKCLLVSVKSPGCKSLMENMKVSALELKTLRMSLSKKYPGENVLIDAPKLEKLDVQTHLEGVSNYSLDARSLVNANIDFDDYFADRASLPKHAIALLAGISNVKYLSLKTSYLRAGELPFFPNLNKLKVVVYRCKYWDLLAVLLENAPNLEDLDLEDGTMRDEKHSKLHWKPPKVVPNCLLSHLKTITLCPFRGQKIDMELAEYLLNNGHLLDKMTLYASYFWHTLDVGSALRMFNRASMTCQVEYNRINRY